MRKNAWLVGVLMVTATAALGQEKTPKVLIIGIDGLRPDAIAAAKTPNLDRLMENGSWSLEARTDQYTVSGPGWSDMLTGAWSSRHEVVDNNFMRPRYDRYPHFFQRLKEADPDLVTASFITWEPIHRLLINDRICDHPRFHDYEDDGDAKMVPQAVEVLSSEPVDCAFYYFADVDSTGHAHGFHRSVPQYLAELEQVDGQVGELLEAIASRESFDDEDWLVLVSTDHGGTIDGNHGRNEPKHRRIPYIASGESAARGEILPVPNVVDIPVTAMVHLGIELDPAWGMDGVVSGLAKRQRYMRNLVVNGGAEHNDGCSDPVIDLGVPGWVDTGSMTVIAYGSPNGYPDADSPGPPAGKRGRNFFAGSAEEDAEMSQTISLEEFAADIDAGVVHARFGAWLGGYADQRDLAEVHCAFLDERGGFLGELVLRPVTVDDRREAAASDDPASWTMLIRRSVGPRVPKGARRAVITVSIERHNGLADGYVDDVSLSLRKRL